MGIVKGIIAPHPPIIVPEVGGSRREKAQQTVQAMEEAADIIKQADPELIIITTPHGAVFRDALAVSVLSPLAGNLAAFGAKEVNFHYSNDIQVAEEIIRRSNQKGIPAVALGTGLAREYRISLKLDHGVTVPLYFIQKAGVTCPILPISMGFLSFEELYQFGAVIKEVTEMMNRRVVFLASGDLSHRLTKDAPAGYHPKGKEYDALLIDLLVKKQVEDILKIDPALVETAGECGLRSFIMMLGSFDGYDFEFRLLSYEGPFGVGYLVGEINPGEPSPDRMIVKKIFQERQGRIEERRKQESPPVALARRALEAYVTEGKIIEPPKELSDFFLKRAGIFVSIKKHGQLRGCIGTVEPTQENLALEIIHNALSAGTRDPRFNPVSPDELNELTYSVDMLYPPEPISGIDELDPQKYGVIVRSGTKSGLLLPMLEGIDTPREQVEIARQKAGIRPGESVKLSRFEVVRYY
ncbi:MAG: AmmeMemoRadiSam system protein A [Bacillota bacterium]|jgi:AmmeMemoRadiSam system protein A|nr:AmmeMemoRadiSam system protein A [Clostridia bacterium]